MFKLIVFDLDKTLADLGKGMSARNVAKLRKLEKLGARIAICSGKPAYYLCGFMRQIGLKKPVLIGENGATVQFGVDLPPSEFYVLTNDESAKKTLKKVQADLDEIFDGKMWFQPNSVCVTPFPKTETEFDVIQRYVDEHAKELACLKVYRHIDSFDFVPCGTDKKIALGYLANLLHITNEETIAVGDGVNDYPMFDFAKLSVGVNVAQSGKVDFNFKSTSEALDFLLKTIKEQTC